MTRINLWSSPRNISTALMYAFAQRADTTVYDEPLYAHYLTHTKTDADHPGKQDILNSQEKDGNKVVQNQILGDHPTPIAVFKQMTHHLLHLKEDFLYQTQNVLLVRDPALIIASYSKVIPNPTITDVGIEKQYYLFQQLKERGQTPAVLSARQLLLNPEKVLRTLCNNLDIPFDEKMLCWEAGPRPEDGVWAKYWYTNVHRSTGFQPYQAKNVDLNEKLKALAQQCAPYYEYLFEYAIKA